MARELLDDELWEIVRPLLSARRRRKTYSDRKSRDDRCVLTGILFVLQSGIPWEMLPQEMGCGSGILLATAAGLAKGWRVEKAAPGAIGQAAWR